MIVVLVVMGLMAGLGVFALIRGAVWVFGRGAGRWPLIDSALFGLAGLVAVALGYGLWVEPGWLEVSTITVRTAPWSAGDPVRVVQFSDLHSPSNAALQRRLPSVIRQLKPDVIVFTGDLINGPEGLVAARATLAEVAQIAPTYGIRGDVDPPFEDLFSGTGVVELRGLRYPLAVRNHSFSLVGWSQHEDWKHLYGTFTSTGEDEFVVFLGHSPDAADDLSRWGANLYLAGHTHGGQVGLPWYGALWTASLYGKRFEAGRYHLGDMDLWINRGIGMAKRLPPVRFLARPEVTLLLIEGER